MTIYARRKSEGNELKDFVQGLCWVWYLINPDKQNTYKGTVSGSFSKRKRLRNTKKMDKWRGWESVSHFYFPIKYSFCLVLKRKRISTCV